MSKKVVSKPIRIRSVGKSSLHMARYRALAAGYKYGRYTINTEQRKRAEELLKLLAAAVGEKYADQIDY